jgi:hypothetical protein
MRSEEKIITRNKSTYTTLKATNNSNLSNLKPFNFYGNGLRLGLLAGIAMSIYLLAINALGFNESIGVKYLKYFILLGTLIYGLNKQKDTLGSAYTFRSGMGFGLFISIVSAAVLLVASLLSYGLTDSLAFQKFNINGGKFGYTAVVGALIFIETFVYGMIMTFINLQFLKNGAVNENLK